MVWTKEVRAFLFHGFILLKRLFVKEPERKTYENNRFRQGSKRTGKKMEKTNKKE